MGSLADKAPSGWNYPFPALVGQEEMKTALLLLAVDPRLGGVLLVGHKGAAKSTAVRSLSGILPPVEAADCPFHCPPDAPDRMCPECREKYIHGELRAETVPAPLVTLPLGATEDRVVGGIDIGATIRSGRPRLRPGVLGAANRGYLYVDEVNLLEPYLAHLLLDAVETGRLRVEREGLSLVHPAETGLIGTMNPEEGALGPQFMDRFALAVPVEGEKDAAARKEIVRRRLDFESDPDGFRRRWAGEERELTRRIEAARRRLPGVELTESARGLASELARQAGVRGHRGDLALARAARSLAAWRGDAQAGEDCVLAAAEPALGHRRVKTARSRVKVEKGEIRAPVDQYIYEKPYTPPKGVRYTPAPGGEESARGPRSNRLHEANAPFEINTPVSRRDQGPRGRSGRRTSRRTDQARGRYYRSSLERLGRPVALDATLRAAAPHQAARRAQTGRALVIKPPDVREKVYRRKTGRLVLFVVDASGSVGSLDRMAEAKAAVLSLLSEAYRKRDRVGLIAFHGAEAEVLLPPTNSVDTAARLLDDLPTGGKTPLAAALVAAHHVVRSELARDPGLNPLVVLMTDGRANVPLTPGADPWRESWNLAAQLARDSRLRFVIVDTDHGHYASYGMTPELAEKLAAPRLSLDDLRLGRLMDWLEQVA